MRLRSENPSFAVSGGRDMDPEVVDLLTLPKFSSASVPALTASSNETLPSRTTSSTLRPLFRFVRRPFSKPASPPRAWKAARLLGLISLFSWPGEKANLLSSTTKSDSVPGSGFSASSSLMRSPLYDPRRGSSVPELDGKNVSPP